MSERIPDLKGLLLTVLFPTPTGPITLRETLSCLTFIQMWIRAYSINKSLGHASFHLREICSGSRVEVEDIEVESIEVGETIQMHSQRECEIIGMNLFRKELPSYVELYGCW